VGRHRRLSGAGPGGSLGYRYKDRLLALGPVKAGTIKPGKLAKLAAKRAGLAHLLERIPLRSMRFSPSGSRGLRYRLAFDHALCRAVVRVLLRAVLGWYRRRARRAGWPTATPAR
jgi:hypothetical protein